MTKEEWSQPTLPSPPCIPIQEETLSRSFMFGITPSQPQLICEVLDSLVIFSPTPYLPKLLLEYSSKVIILVF